MKRSSDNSNSALKKVRSTEPVMHPPHHFHLGGENFVFVSDFSDTLRVHIRKFRRINNDRLVPTTMGVTLLPVQWQTLADDFESLIPTYEKPELVKDCLMLSMVDNENTTNIVLQRYVKRKDFIRVFLPSVCLLSELEWENLKDIRKEVTKDITSVLYGRLFPKIILKEVSKQTRSNTTNIENCDAEMVLTTSLMELLKQHLKMKIDELFICSGCDANYENQLGHECITFNYNQRLSRCGNLAFFSIDLELLANEFIQHNLHIVNYITEEFLSKLNVHSMLTNVKEIYVTSDPDPLRMF